MLKTRVVSNANRRSTRNVYKVNVSNVNRKYMTSLNAFFVLLTTSKTNVYSMHCWFSLTPASVMKILKFFMHVSLLCILEDFLPEKSANYMLSWKIHTSSANKWFSSESYLCTRLKIKYISLLAVLSILILNRGGSKS